MTVNLFKSRLARRIVASTALLGTGIAIAETPALASPRSRIALSRAVNESDRVAAPPVPLRAIKIKDVTGVHSQISPVALRRDLDANWRGLSDKRSERQEMPAPTEPGHFALARLGTMSIPLMPEVGRVKIDMFIQSKFIYMKGLKGEGNDRGFDMNAPTERSKAVIDLDFGSGVGTVYVSPSCMILGSPVCIDAYDLSDDGDRATNQFAYSVDDTGIRIRYSFENAAAKNFRFPFSWVAERQNPSIDGKITVRRDPNGMVSLKGDIDRFPSFAAYQVLPNGYSRTICELAESSDGVSALRGAQQSLAGPCFERKLA